MKYKVIFSIATAAVLMSCSSWTEPESVKISNPSISEEDGYDIYVSSLNDYKSRSHKVMIASVDNPSGRPARIKPERLTSLPDSVDVIVLQNPADLYGDYLEEIEAVRRLGTKVLYRISGSAADEGLSGLKGMLSLYDRYSYDGIVFDYEAPSTAGIGKDAIEEIKARENSFWTEVMSWQSSHKDAMLIFAGKPQYLLDASVLTLMEYIVIDGTGSSSISELLKDIMLALPADDIYPTDRFIVEVNAPTPALYVENGEDELGYFWNYSDGRKLTAIEGAAKCVLTQSERFSMAGVMVRNAQNDYYHQGDDFINIRRAITLLNPTTCSR